MSQVENVIVTLGTPEYKCPRTIDLFVQIESVNEDPIKPWHPVVYFTGSLVASFDWSPFIADGAAAGAATVHFNTPAPTLGAFHVSVQTTNNPQAGNADGTVAVTSPTLAMFSEFRGAAGGIGTVRVSGSIIHTCPVSCPLTMAGYWYGPNNLTQVHAIGVRTVTPTLDQYGRGVFSEDWTFPTNALGFEAIGYATDPFGQQSNTEDNNVNTQ